jgi:hypothetical protein
VGNRASSVKGLCDCSTNDIPGLFRGKCSCTQLTVRAPWLRDHHWRGKSACPLQFLLATSRLSNWRRAKLPICRTGPETFNLSMINLSLDLPRCTRSRGSSTHLVDTDATRGNQNIGGILLFPYQERSSSARPSPSPYQLRLFHYRLPRMPSVTQRTGDKHCPQPFINFQVNDS